VPAIVAAEHSNPSSSVLSIGSLPPSPTAPETAASDAVESAVAELAPSESSSGSHSVSRAYRTRRGASARPQPRDRRCVVSRTTFAHLGRIGVRDCVHLQKESRRT